MNYDEIENLRKAGNLEEAYQKASQYLKEVNQTHTITEHQFNTDNDSPEDETSNGNIGTAPDNPINLSKIAMAWVLYEYLKNNTDRENFDNFYAYLTEYQKLDLGENGKLVTNQLLWLISKAVFEFSKTPDFEIAKMEQLFDLIKTLYFTRQNKGYSVLFKAFHKALKDSDKYIELAEWWDFSNFINDDYNYTLNADGTKIMAIAEQAYNKYCKRLIYAINNTDGDEEEKLKEKINQFVPQVAEVCRRNRFYHKLHQNHVRLLIAGGNYPKAFSLLMEKAKKQGNDFWVWEMIADAYDTDQDKKLACLFYALKCKTNSKNVIAIREKVARIFVEMELFDEAKTEIAQILRICHFNKLEIPDSVAEWGDRQWYRDSAVNENNDAIYRKYYHFIEDIIYQDIPQRKVVVEYVNQPRKILNFIGSDLTKGYFKFDKNFGKLKEGDVLLVRLKELDQNGRFEMVHGKKIRERHIEGLLKDFAGEVVIMQGKPFGFVSGLFIPPDICKKYRLEHGDRISGIAMLSYNKKKDDWGWKVTSID
jgi:hypothetical protein